jgi:hypothetical protein
MAWARFANDPDFTLCQSTLSLAGLKSCMVLPMRQRGRKSAASLVVITGGPSRLVPPDDLSDEEKALFLDLVNACSPRHFVESDKPLLISFVQATLMARGSAGKGAVLISTWEKAVRIQATLATRLRLAPQARLDPKTVGRFQQSSGPKPWELGKNAKR